MRLLKKMTILPVLLLSGMLVKSQTLAVETPIADMLDSLSTQKMFETAFTRPVFPKNNKFKFDIFC